MTFRRVDLLLSQKELEDLHRKLYNPPSNFSLFSDEKFWSLSPKEYMPLFTSPTPEGNYGTLVASTAGHWTTTLLHGFRDESKANSGYGIDKVLDFFEQAMKMWAKEVQEALNQDQRNGSKGVNGTRRVVVRSYLPGHEDCRKIYKPWKKWKPYVWNWYNWPWIKDFNQILQVCPFFQESRVAYTNAETIESVILVFVPRYTLPDNGQPGTVTTGRGNSPWPYSCSWCSLLIAIHLQHVTGDCLHIMTGPGIMEGWSHYIWHFVTRELRGRIR